MQLLDIPPNSQITAKQQLEALNPTSKTHQINPSRPKKQKKMSYSSKKGKNNKANHWNEFQQRRYIRFLQQSGHLLELSVTKRRNLKINQMMSKKIKSRNASQCHSHHQKMLFTHHSIEEIIQKNLYLFQNEPTYFTNKPRSPQSLKPQPQHQQYEQKIFCQLIDYTENLFTIFVERDPLYWVDGEYECIFDLSKNQSSISEKLFNAPTIQSQSLFSYARNKQIIFSNSEEFDAQAMKLFWQFSEDKTENAYNS